MTVDRLYRNLVDKLINANIDLDAYLQLRKAKGYMSVSESDHLRDNLFELCHEMRERAPRLQNVIALEEKEALRLAGEAIASAAVCLMSGHHDCPSYIAVNVDKLENCLTVLTLNIHKLNDSAPITHA
ncbi:biofilm formation regulator BssR [Klebsiella oxytoca]|uniref:Biofilm formation regulator BssR n=1 Tax=Klebsiella oxytoca TaxID=571 RepID=A0A6B8MR33_KLEOX|nr:biofilm formation regulator BssR [Klebsiella oxytoca]QGN37386.1 biofilm formation regulator BssR [Klebsiella oxytoca]